MMHENMIRVKKLLLVPMVSGLLVSLMSFAQARHHHRSSEVQDSSDVTVQDDIKALLGNLIEYFTDEESAKDVREGLDTEFDSQVTTDGVYNSYVRISYFNDGWPQEVVSQNNISLGDRQKLTQKHITWDHRSVGHAE